MTTAADEALSIYKMLESQLQPGTRYGITLQSASKTIIVWETANYVHTEAFRVTQIRNNVYEVGRRLFELLVGIL